MARVSVIIPTFNRAHVLGAALDSVLDQTFQDFEIIVIDDHSTDSEATRQLVASYQDERIRYFYLERNLGPSGARNFAASVSSGQYLAFLDSDDLYRPEKLQNQLALLEQNPEAAMVYSDEFIMDEAGRVSATPHHANRTPPLPSGHIAPDFFQDSFIGTMTVTLRRSVFLAAGGFDEALIWNEDDDLWLRIMLRHPVLFSDYPAGIRRVHTGNMSRDRHQMTSYQLRCIQKYLQTEPVFVTEHHPKVVERLNKLLITYLRSAKHTRQLPRWRVISQYLALRRTLLPLRNQSSIDRR